MSLLISSIIFDIARPVTPSDSYDARDGYEIIYTGIRGHINFRTGTRTTDERGSDDRQAHSLLADPCDLRAGDKVVTTQATYEVLSVVPTSRFGLLPYTAADIMLVSRVY